MNFGELKANVQSAMGRSDIPDYVYALTEAGIARDLRILDMETATTFSTTTGSTVTLPADFLEFKTLFIDSGGSRNPLLPMSEGNQAVRHDSSGRPAYYALTNGAMELMPSPDGTYEITARYFARPATLTLDADTNAILTDHPDLYLYGALTHAAVWAKDTESAQTYNSAFTTAQERARKADMRARMGGRLTKRPTVSNF